MSGRPWSEEERAFLRRSYRSRTKPQIAGILGRSVKSVYQSAVTLGLERQRRVRVDGRFRAELVRLHSEGWTDPEIAAELGCDRHTVSRHRHRLGLGSNRDHRRYRRRVAARTREQCSAAGVRNLAEVRALAWARRSARAGWSTGLRPRAVQILDALWERGPLTRREIAEAVGMPWKGSRASLTSNDPEGSYLAHLLATGYVVSLGRLKRGVGKGRSQHVYCLALGVGKGGSS